MRPVRCQSEILNFKGMQWYLKFGISERFLSSSVALRRLDCIGSWGASTKNQQIFLRIYRIRQSDRVRYAQGTHAITERWVRDYRCPLCWILFYWWNFIDRLVATADFQVIIVMWVIAEKRQWEITIANQICKILNRLRNSTINQAVQTGNLFPPIKQFK